MAQQRQEESALGMQMDNSVEAAAEVAVVLAMAFHQDAGQLSVDGQMEMITQ